MKEFIHFKYKNNILSLKSITYFNDSFFRMKVYTPNFNQEKFVKVFEKAIYQELKFHILDVLNGIIRFFFFFFSAFKIKFNI